MNVSHRESARAHIGFESHRWSAAQSVPLRTPALRTPQCVQNVRRCESKEAPTVVRGGCGSIPTPIAHAHTVCPAHHACKCNDQQTVIGCPKCAEDVCRFQKKNLTSDIFKELFKLLATGHHRLLVLDHRDDLLISVFI